MVRVKAFRSRWKLDGIATSALVCGVLVSGCGDESPTGTGGTPEPVREFWQGTYAAGDQSDRGSTVLDIVRTGSDVVGELAFRSRVAADPYDHLFVKGTATASGFQLGPNMDLVDYPFGFSLNATAADSQAAGTFTYAPTGLAADLVLRELPLGSLTVQWSLSKAEGILGLAFDGTDLWAGTLTDFLRMDADGADVGRVTVYYRPGARWTSDALTADGTWLWGQYPETVVDQTGSHNRSVIVKFAEDGTVDDTYEIPVRAAGLAEEGGDLWVLPIESDGFHRFDASANDLEDVEVAIPDMVDLDVDGSRFWAIGWFLNVLYEIDRSGTVIRAYTLPRQTGIEFPAGIVTDGSSFWYAAGGFELVTTIYRMRLNP
jgi:hypothetical protein